jgi:Uma2 family endonuclease
MSKGSVVLTYRDYEALPNDGRRYEIHDGELSVTPAPTPRHQGISRDLFDALWAHVKAHRLGTLYYAPIDVILADTTIVQPDIVYLDNDRLSGITSRGIEGPPTLVIEILSPSTTAIDRHTKRQLYARFGVPHYWIVDPDSRVIEAYALAGAAYAVAAHAVGAADFSAPPFPDLVIPVAAIFG